MGAALDGPIKYPAYGKVHKNEKKRSGISSEPLTYRSIPRPCLSQVAAIRSPDGHMIGLFEPGDGAPVAGPPASGEASRAP